MIRSSLYNNKSGVAKNLPGFVIVIYEYLRSALSDLNEG